MSKAFVLEGVISLDTKEISNKLNEVEREAKNVTKNIDDMGKQSVNDSNISKFGNAISKVGEGVVAVGKKVAEAVAVASTAVGALATASVSQYANYEQLVGGVETLFKDSSNTVMQYANDAYMTAGLSANEYMETITGFSASLLQSLGGDTAKASEIGNQAVIDMSDNANKMGTSMESIQNAYQGFAKQNYTMLDNLKLGYGGTKEEMQRLLADAEKLTGIKYDINNFSDVTQAIHAIQTEMGITGTTSKEAMSTIQGAFNMTKSSWTNLMTALGTGNPIDTQVNNLVTSASALLDNIIPVAENALNGISTMIDTLLPKVLEKLPELLSTLLPQLLQSGNKIVTSLGNAIIQALPLITTLIQQNLPQFMNMAMTIISQLTTALLQMLPQLLQMGIDIIVQLALGIAQQAPTLIPQMVNCLITLVMTLLDNINLIIDAGIQLIMGLAQGLINALPQLIEKAPEIISKLTMAIANNAPKLLEMGIKLIIMLAQGLIQAIPQLLSSIPSIMGSLISSFGTYVGNMADVGKNLVQGLWNGISNAKDWVLSKIKGFGSDVLDGIKGFFGIHSPSRVMRDEVGKYLAEGIGVGMEMEMPSVNADISRTVEGTVDVIKSVNVKNNNNNNSNSRIESLLTTLIQAVKENKTISIDGKQITRAIAPYQNEFTKYSYGR